MDALYVEYTGLALPYISTVPNTNLSVVLSNINTAINNMNPAPNYSSFNYGPYNGYTITTITGGVPANAQQFTEGISKIVDIDQYNLHNFITVTYAGNQSTLTTAITNLQTPGVTYSPYSITNTMTVTQTWNTLFTGITGTIASISPTAANWSSISVSPSPTTLVAAFNDIIAYAVGLNTAIGTKQSTIGTFDNSSNCLAGTSTDSLSTTIGLLTSEVCGKPSFTVSGFTWGGITTGTDLQSSVQNIANSTNYLLQNGIIGVGSGIVSSTMGSTYQGYKVAMDSTYLPYYKTVLSTDTYSNAGFLDQKIVGDETTIHTSIVSNQIVLSSLVGTSSIVAVNSSDTAPNFLANKIPTTIDNTWGLALQSSPSASNSQLLLTPTLSNPELFNQALINFISTDPSSLILWTNFIAQINSGSAGSGISNLVVTLTTGTFVLTWTHQSGISQNAKWRQRGTSTWNISMFTPSDPLSSTAVTTTGGLNGVNIPYQFQVDTVYANGTVGSNIYEMINYFCQTLSHTFIAGSSISVNQPALIDIFTIQYQLYDTSPSPVLLQTINTSGSSPAVTFTGLSSGSYTVKWRYGTLINGTTLYSDDPSQLNAYCSSGTITI